MTIKSKELREAAEQKAVEARKEFDAINDKMSEGEAKEAEARFDSAMSEHDKLAKKAEQSEKLDKIEKDLSERSKRGQNGNPNEKLNLDGGQDDEGSSPSYREAFHQMLKSGGDLSELSSEHRTVLRQGAGEFRAQSTGTNSAGGFTVPVELQNVLIETMKMHGPMYDGSLVTELNTTNGVKFQMPTIDDTSQTSASKAENAAIVDDGSGDAVFGRKEMDAYVYATPFVKWSMELGDDSIFNVESLLNTLIGKRLGRGANAQLTLGTGSSQPNGIVTATGAGITAASATAIVSDEIIDLFHSIDPAYRAAGGSLAYMMNDQTLSVLRKLKDGQGNYLWQQGDIQKGIPATLNGVRVVVNQDMPGIATGNKAILFGDFKQYYVRKVGSPLLGVMKERFWPDLGIAGLIRFDGELADESAIKALVMA